MTEREEEAPRARVEVWRQAEGAWRWRFVQDGDGEESLELASNTIEPSEEAAITAAALAYPGLPVHVPGPASDEAAPKDSHRWIWRGATASLSFVLAALALRYHRWWTALAAPLLAHGVVTGLRRRLS